MNVDQLFDHTLRALVLSKSLAQNGYATGPYLGDLAVELRKAHDVLKAKKGAPQQVLAAFIDAAIDDINITRYLEESQKTELQQVTAPHGS